MAFRYRNPSNDYYQHDNRRGGGSGPSRGHSRMRYQNNRMTASGRSATSGSHVLTDGDGDICMGGDDTPRVGGRYAPYSKPGFIRTRGGSRSNHGRTVAGNSETRDGERQVGRSGNSRKGQGHRRFPDETHWHRVLIPSGRRIAKDYLLNILAANCRVPFTPINYHSDGSAAIFFLEDGVAADEIGRLHHKLMTPDGQKISLVVRQSSPPSGPLPDDLDDIVKAGIGRRYNPSIGELNLSRFHQDADFKSKGNFLPLFRLKVAQIAVDVLTTSVNNLVVLNLNGNRLKVIDLFVSFIKSQTTLKTLLLADNLLSNISELDAIGKPSVEELALKNNPLLKSFHNRTQLFERLRKIFPRLRRLDGVNLPPIISFGLEGTSTVPTSQGSFFVNDVGRDIAIQFLKQYFTIYDSEDRSSLADAYHDTAVFALSPRKANWGTVLTSYNRIGRNLLRVLDPDRRSQFLFSGKRDIVECLQTLPRTEHDPASLVVDVCVATEAIVTVTSSGVFREVLLKREHDLRAFSRTFVLIPYGTGYNIVNDLLVVTNATPHQMTKAFQTPTSSIVQTAGLSTSSTTTAAGIDAATSALSATSIASPTVEAQLTVQQQMIAAFSLQSGMTNAWSTRCLEDNNWNFDKAAECFRELNSKGTIPREAFHQQ